MNENLGGLLVSALIWTLALPALAQDDVIKAGQALFQRKCAVCHGIGAAVRDGDRLLLDARREQVERREAAAPIPLG